MRRRGLIVLFIVPIIVLVFAMMSENPPNNGDIDTVMADVVLAQEEQAAQAEETTTPSATVTATAPTTETQDDTPTEAADSSSAVPSITGETATASSIIPTTRDAVLTPDESLPVDASIQLVQVADGLVDPVNVVSAHDGSGRLFVVERHGVVRIVTDDGEVLEEPFLDIQDQVLSAFLEQGLYDIEFHPNYAENGRFFVHFAELLRNGDGMIVEYAVSKENPNKAEPDSAQVILELDQPWANHNGGELAFGPDGYLYIGSGDGGWEGDPLEAGEDVSTLLGKLLRIDVDTQDGRNYAIPEDNPFADAQNPDLVQLFGITEEEFAKIHSTARPEIWAYGLRNPWKFSFDPKTGDLYLPDVGQNYWEEINFQPADSSGGENYGWDFLMGSHCFPIEQEDCASVGVLPVAEYSHPIHSGCSIIGIGVYRGDEYPNLDGIYFSGDYCSGKIWGLMLDDENNWHYAEVADTDLVLTGSGQDEDGTLYVTSCHCFYGGGDPVENPPGALWRIEAASGEGEADVGGTASEAIPEGTPTATPTPQEGQAQDEAGDGAETMPEAGAEGAAVGGQEDILATGEQLYLDYCAGCHQLSGEGNTAYPALNNNPIVTAEDPTQAIMTIWHGRGQMPGFSDELSAEEIAAVLSHERTSWDNNASVVTVEQVQAALQGDSQSSTQATGTPEASSPPQNDEAMQSSPQVSGQSATTGTTTDSSSRTVIPIEIYIVVTTPTPAGGD